MANILNLWLHVATSCLLMLLQNKKCQLKLKFWDIKLKSCLCTLQSIAYNLLNSQSEIVHIFTLLLWSGLCWIVSQRKSSFWQRKWLFFNIWLVTFCSPHKSIPYPKKSALYLSRIENGKHFEFVASCCYMLSTHVTTK